MPTIKEINLNKPSVTVDKKMGVTQNDGNFLYLDDSFGSSFTNPRRHYHYSSRRSLVPDFPTTDHLS